MTTAMMPQTNGATMVERAPGDEFMTARPAPLMDYRWTPHTYDVEMMGPIDWWLGWIKVSDFVASPEAHGWGVLARFAVALGLAVKAGMDPEDIHSFYVAGRPDPDQCGSLLSFGFKQSNNGTTCIVTETGYRVSKEG